ncbi:MAG: hypothetical protein LBP93_01920 [Treponema sp.]|jgi:phage-related baseplate assembly protein|nr:hypothetical protein [Treponema sp.]
MVELDADVSLFEDFAVRDKGFTLTISPEDPEKGRRDFVAACEESDREKRARMADAAEAISHIYLTF